MKKELILISALALLLTGLVFPQPSSDDSTGSNKITIYFFWGQGCPHCTAMKPYIGKITAKYPQIEVRSMEIFNNEENSKLFDETAQAYGKTATLVPTTFIADQMIEGYNGIITENKIEAIIAKCTQDECTNPDQMLVEFRSGLTSSTSTSTTTSTTSASTSTSTTTSTVTTTTRMTTTTTTTTTSTTTSMPPVTTSTRQTTTTAPELGGGSDGNDTGAISIAAIFLAIAAAILLFKKH